MSPARIRIVVCSMALLGLLLAPVAVTLAADEGGEKKAERRPSPYAQATGGAKKGAVKSYSNDDLERMFGPSTPAGTTASPGEDSETPDSASNPTSNKSANGKAVAGDPLKQLLEGEKKRDEQQTQIVAATQKVVEAEKKISELERRALALRNPLLPRPAAPEEGAEEWNAADTTGRLDQNEAAIDSARAELEKAREELARLQQSSP